MSQPLGKNAEPEEHMPSAFAVESHLAVHHLVVSSDEVRFLHGLKAPAPRGALHHHATDRVTLFEAVHFHGVYRKLWPDLNNHQPGIHFDHQNAGRPPAHPGHGIRNNVVEGQAEHPS